MVCLWLQGLHKKDGQKCNPNDFRSEALSVSRNMVNDSHFRALSLWLHVYVSKI